MALGFGGVRLHDPKEDMQPGSSFAVHARAAAGRRAGGAHEAQGRRGDVSRVSELAITEQAFARWRADALAGMEAALADMTGPRQIGQSATSARRR